MKLLKTDGLKKLYHTNQGETLAVEDFTFEMNEGEFIAIVGPSGCGKSTILSILCDLEKASEGSFAFKENTKIGYMLQNDCLFDFRNILDNCLIGLEINKTLTKSNKNYVLKLLQTYGLNDFINSYPPSLSGGMKQRVALIRTLAIKPDIILFDEPFSALDYQTRLSVSDDVYNIIKKENKSVIMVTHDLAEAISMADKVIILSSRPSYIKKIFSIKLSDRGTPIQNRKSVDFAKYYEMIWKEIDHHV